ncbi:hypothetical protein BgAZ_500880 [Babesia gibsoni]|uniref:Uncharacterized protein n=1 Tax=Babesia gibsoni TaxID=33632 RepID=A0AAD8LMB3_BABGI|nr:hypothetical protein BgAZ_500880 [Babesia gibsoni]
MKGASSKERQTVGSSKSMEQGISLEALLKQPWKFWKQKEQCESLLRNSLLDSIKGAVELQRRRVYVKDEISKKRSRNSAAVKRAFAASRKDANRVRESIVPLGLDDLWACLEREVAGGIEPLKVRVESLVKTVPECILRPEYRNFEKKGRGTTSASAQKSKAGANRISRGRKTKVSKSSDSDEDYVDDSQGSEASGSDSDEGSLYDGEDDDVSDFDEGSLEDGHDSEMTERQDTDKKRAKKGAKSLNDKFFSMDAMEEFANQDFDNEAGDFNYFESMGEESDDSKAAVEMMYGDFFDNPDDDDDDSDSGESEEALDCSRDLEGLDEDEREMELLLQKVENDEYTEDEEPDGRDDDELAYFENMQDDASAEEDEAVEGIPDDDPGDEISRVEKELVSQKHWSLMGEATGKKRPRNSLLDLDIELPQNSSFIHVDKADVAGADDQEGDAMGEEEAQDIPIEIIIQQRIKAAVFDNVERKISVEDQLEAIERLKKTRNKMNNEDVEIDFNKSKMGLGDIYAKRYQDMFLATDKLDDHKKKLTEDFSKLMFKLDALCNYNIVPKRVSEAEKSNDASLITVEAPINVVTASRHNDLVDDTMEGNKVTRNAKKRKFTNKLKGLLKSGKATIEDINRIKQKAMQVNKQKIEDARSIKLTGQTAKQGLQERKRSNRRVNISELMSKNT